MLARRGHPAAGRAALCAGLLGLALVVGAVLLIRTVADQLWPVVAIDPGLVAAAGLVLPRAAIALATPPAPPSPAA